MAVQKWHLANDEAVTVHRGGNVWRSSPVLGSIRLGHVQRLHKQEDDTQWIAMTADGHSFIAADRVAVVRWLIEQAGLHLQS